MDKIKRIKELTSELNKYRHEYYNLNKPSMSDKEYDDKFDELRRLELEIGFVMANSPSQTVGFEVKSKLDKVEHSIPLKSLDKTKDIDDLKKFIGNQEVLIMLKNDGLTCETIYNNGELVQGSTRGNGIIGENISHNVKTFTNIPLKVDEKGYLKLVGEAIILNDDFISINSKLSEEDRYSNSRNLVAGSVRQLDSKICSQRNVNLIVFGLIECESKEFTTLEEQFIYLKELGFSVVPYIKYQNSNGSLEEIINELKNISAKKGIPIDGLVISYNNLSYADSLGETSHHPLGKISYKFYDEEYQTKYIKTEWQVSRTSLINPVGVFQPVDLDGAMTERATLHNIDYFRGLQLGEGDIITVARQNQVIPKILDNITRSNTEIIPTKCPICEGDTEIRLLKTANVLVCKNENCPAKKTSQIVHACKRDCLNIDGISEFTIEKFIEKGFINSITDLYKLKQYRNQIINMEGFGLKSYNNMIESIEKSKKCKLENFLFALGIPNVGRSTANDLAKKFKTIENLLVCDKAELLNMNDMGEVTANSVYEFFHNNDNLRFLGELNCHVTIIQEEKKKIQADGNNILYGKHVYPTGKFNLKKEELKQRLEDVGAIVESGYKKSLDYLILGGDISKSGKADKAKADGVPMMSEEEMLKHI